MSYEEEDTCISKGCQVEHVIESHLQSMSYEEDTCMSYEEEDTCMSYEEEDTCEWLGSF